MANIFFDSKIKALFVSGEKRSASLVAKETSKQQQILHLDRS